MLLCKSKVDDRSKIEGMKRNNYNVNRRFIKIFDKGGYRYVTHQTSGI